MSSKCKFSFFVLTHGVVCRGNLRNNDFLTDALSVCVLTLFKRFSPMCLSALCAMWAQRLQVERQSQVVTNKLKPSHNSPQVW